MSQNGDDICFETLFGQTVSPKTAKWGMRSLSGLTLVFFILWGSAAGAGWFGDIYEYLAI